MSTAIELDGKPSLGAEVGVAVGFALEVQEPHGSQLVPREIHTTASNKTATVPAHRKFIVGLLRVSSTKSAFRLGEIRLPPRFAAKIDKMHREWQTISAVG